MLPFVWCGRERIKMKVLVTTDENELFKRLNGKVRSFKFTRHAFRRQFIIPAGICGRRSRSAPNSPVRFFRLGMWNISGFSCGCHVHEGRHTHLARIEHHSRMHYSARFARASEIGFACGRARARGNETTSPPPAHPSNAMRKYIINLHIKCIKRVHLKIKIHLIVGCIARRHRQASALSQPCRLRRTYLNMA